MTPGLTVIASFTIVDMSPALPYLTSGGDAVTFVVIFEPSVNGAVSVKLIVDTADTMYEVNLTGEGTNEPVATIGNIINFLAAALEEEMIYGWGNNPSAENKVQVFRQFLESAAAHNDVGNVADAYDTLRRAYVCSDGLPSPKDFIEGSAVPELNKMIGDLMASIGCDDPGADAIIEIGGGKEFGEFNCLADIVSANYERIHNPLEDIRKGMDAIYWLGQGFYRQEVV